MCPSGGGGTRPGGTPSTCPLGRGATPATRTTVWPAVAAIWAARARGPEMSASRRPSRGSQDASCASATAWWKRQYGDSDPGSPTAVALAVGLTVTPAVAAAASSCRMGCEGYVPRPAGLHPPGDRNAGPECAPLIHDRNEGPVEGPVEGPIEGWAR